MSDSVAQAPPARPFLRVVHQVENWVGYGSILLLALIPATEVVVRKVFKTGIPASADYVRHLVLWVTMVGGMITSRQGRHLSLTAGQGLLPDRVRPWITAGTSAVAAAIATALALGSLSFVLIGFDFASPIGPFRVQWLVAIMPVGFTVIAGRFVFGANVGWKFRLLSATGVLVGLVLAWESIVNVIMAVGERLVRDPEGQMAFLDALDEFYFSAYDTLAAVTGALHVPLVILLLVSAVLGAPIFVLLGGLGYLFLLRSGGVPEAVANEAYAMISGPAIPAIPLFTLVGFMLSAGKAGERLVRLFRALFGWLPGGLAIVSVLICTFFTSFTGASGVTILALGGILAFILTKNRYDERFAHGLLTVNGIGTLFPPSLAVIMYGAVAQISIRDMFIAGVVPGGTMVLALVAFVVVYAVRRKIPRVRFEIRETLPALRESAWEVFLPVLILLLFFGGITTLVETGAVAVVYVLLVELVFHRDVKPKDLPRVMLRAIPVMGGVLLILAVAKGLAYYVVDAEVPVRLTEWLQTYVGSRYVFLILLNVALLITGCFMDVFSAIMVVVPLILPLGVAYGIDPVHLGIIFLANLQLGYLTPPVGLNLFLASYRFEQPLTKIYRNVVPFLLVMLLSVLLITYIPVLSTGLPALIGG